MATRKREKERQGEIEKRCTALRNHFIEDRGRCYREKRRENAERKGRKKKGTSARFYFLFLSLIPFRRTRPEASVARSLVGRSVCLSVCRGKSALIFPRQMSAKSKARRTFRRAPHFNRVGTERVLQAGHVGAAREITRSTRPLKFFRVSRVERYTHRIAVLATTSVCHYFFLLFFVLETHKSARATTTGRINSSSR